nr:MAG TPA: hypothetical protein [Caudoviricetes sp.]
MFESNLTRQPFSQIKKNFLHFPDHPIKFQHKLAEEERYREKRRTRPLLKKRRLKRLSFPIKNQLS